MHTFCSYLGAGSVKIHSRILQDKSLSHITKLNLRSKHLVWIRWYVLRKHQHLFYSETCLNLKSAIKRVFRITLPKTFHFRSSIRVITGNIHFWTLEISYTYTMNFIYKMAVIFWEYWMKDQYKNQKNWSAEYVTVSYYIEAQLNHINTPNRPNFGL